MDASLDRSLATLTKVVTFLSDLWGADKVYRSLAYGSRAFAYYRAQRVGKDDPLARTAKSVGSAITQARYTVRFWGIIDNLYEFLDIAVAVRKGRTSLTDPDTVVRLGQAVSMFLYHPLEHAYWLDTLSPGLLPPGLGDKLARLSCILWLAYCLLALWNASRHLRLIEDELRAGPPPVMDEGDGAAAAPATDATTRLRELVESRTRIRLRASIQVADSLLALHWSAPNGIGLNDGVIGLLGLYGGLVGAYLKWTSMRSA